MSILFADFIIGVLQVSHQYTETGTSISETVPQSSQVSLFVSLKQFLHQIVKHLRFSFFYLLSFKNRSD
jgi:hypothetical protein